MKKTLLLVLLLPILSGTAQASNVIADLDIRRVRLTDAGVIRVRADYFCPEGHAVPEPGFTQAYVYQYSEELGNPSKAKDLVGITCDGTHHELVVRFVRPRGGLVWGHAPTNVMLHFTAVPEDGSYSDARAGDDETVML
jgi:hypothetical protein